MGKKEVELEVGWRVYCWSFLNGVVMPGAVLGVVELTAEAVRGKGLLRVSRTLPLPAEIAWDVLKSCLLREVPPPFTPSRTQSLTATSS